MDMKYCMIQLVDISIILTPLTTSTRGHSDCFAIPFARSDSYFFCTLNNQIMEFVT